MYAPAINDVSTSALIKYLVQHLIPAELIGAARTRSLLDMNTIVTRVSSSLPLFARCELDQGLRMMVLMRLLKQCADDGTAVPIMQGLIV